MTDLEKARDEFVDALAAFNANPIIKGREAACEKTARNLLALLDASEKGEDSNMPTYWDAIREHIDKAERFENRDNYPDTRREAMLALTTLIEKLEQIAPDTRKP